MPKPLPVTLRCCSCGDARLKKLSLIYMDGTTKTQNTALAFYRGFSRQALITSAGTRQTLLARRAAPPKKRSPGLRMFLWFVFACIVCILSIIFHSWAVTILLLLTVAGAGGLHVRDAIQYNEKTWPNLYNRWNRSFLCRQCGTVTIF